METVLSTALSLGYALPDDEHTRDRGSSEENTTLALITLLESLDEIQQTLTTLKTQISLAERHNSFRDLISPQILSKRTEQLQNITEHLHRLLANKSRILSHLQQPFVGAFITIRAEHQEALEKLMKQMCADISSFADYIELIEWKQHLPTVLSTLEPSLKQLSLSIAKLQRYTEAITQLRSSMKELHSQYRTSSVASPAATEKPSMPASSLGMLSPILPK